MTLHLIIAAIMALFPAIVIIDIIAGVIHERRHPRQPDDQAMYH